MNPLLTIAIPTWNRATFLDRCLANLRDELQSVEPGLVQILISDNGSTDTTRDIVNCHRNNGLKLDYLVSDRNMGSDYNIAKCFDSGNGEFVLVLADDDLFTSGSLTYILQILKKHGECGVVFLSAFGFSHDATRERPWSAEKYTKYVIAGAFISKLAVKLTLISSIIVNRRKIKAIDPYEFVGSQLVQVPIVLHAALTSVKNIYVKKYCIAVQRDNGGNNLVIEETDRGSRGYNPSEVFAVNLLNLIQENFSKSLNRKYYKALEIKVFIYFLPYYLLQQVRYKSPYVKESLRLLDSQFRNTTSYRVFIRPILILPRPFNIIYAWLATTIGKLIFERPSKIIKKTLLTFGV
ncbi:MAG: glycosyltransferase family 2 protein [Pseudomonadota bacterium]|nr:glycosyltransferase family 2 protein [Pseudomonadota bacterium]